MRRSAGNTVFQVSPFFGEKYEMLFESQSWKKNQNQRKLTVLWRLSHQGCLQLPATTVNKGYGH